VSSRSLASLALFTALAAPLTARSQALDGQPFRTLSASVLDHGQHELGVGAEWRSSIVPVPLLSPVTGDLLQVPVVKWRMGFGRAELQIAWPARQWFSPDAHGVDDENEVGDASFLVDIEAVRQRARRPAFGVALGTKLNNASVRSGLGTDETDVLVALLLSHAGPRHDVRLNIGDAILGDPLTNSSQEDLLTWGVAGRFGGKHALLSEVWGRTDTADDPRDLDEATARLGYGLFLERVSFSASALYGLADVSGELGAEMGVTWSFDAGR
jgi:hypothetical protein